MSSYFLFLDDQRLPRDVTWCKLPNVTYWIVVRNYDQFVATIEMNGIPGYITFDHDLGQEHYPTKQNVNDVIDYSKFKEKTGYDCAKWLVNYCITNNINLPEWNIHSMNPIGKENIFYLLTNFQQRKI